MILHIMFLVVSLVVNALTSRSGADRDKDLEILVSRHQLCILQRKVNLTPPSGGPKKLVLSVAFKAWVKGLRARLDEELLPFKPEWGNGGCWERQ